VLLVISTVRFFPFLAASLSGNSSLLHTVSFFAKQQMCILRDIRCAAVADDAFELVVRYDCRPDRGVVAHSLRPLILPALLHSTSTHGRPRLRRCSVVWQVAIKHADIRHYWTPIRAIKCRTGRRWTLTRPFTSTKRQTVQVWIISKRTLIVKWHE